MDSEWMRIAKQIAEDTMNPVSDFVRRQLEQGKKPNRLIGEKSPYLLQHAFNPVDWYPWGKEAFDKARRENKPIFLSVGYATCHWCHVMEHESFENTEIAAIMNAYFVNIKVDREERPDVDRVYMNAVQAMVGNGGWPMSVFLTPDLKPFYGGTYFPPETRFGRIGFKDLLLRLHEAWETKQADLVQSAERITTLLQEHLTRTSPDTGALDSEILERVYEAFRDSYDSNYGGFGSAPKFPRPSVLNFLFHYYKNFGMRFALDMALSTLDQMARGGIYDHLGGGFHRYSVDQFWRVPHFEKMLYDQAQLVNSYLDAYQITGDARYERIVRETLGYVLRDMTSPKGGFYSAEDADSAPDPHDPDSKKEGAFYMWTLRELETILGPEQAEIVAFAYGVAPEGNTISDPHGEFENRNVLFAAYDPDSIARRFKLSLEEVTRILETCRQTLRQAREKRLRPALDDKIITAWNGLMLSAFARAGMVLDHPEYVETARRAADFLLLHLKDEKTGRLWRRYRDGEARYPGHLDDYAFLANGLIDLYEATADIRYLQEAEQLCQKMLDEFLDPKSGTFFDVSAESKELLFRSKEFYDGAEPAGNSVAILVLLRLARMLDRKSFQDTAERALKSCVPLIREAPSAYPQLAVALDFALSRPLQIVLAGNPQSAAMRRFLREINRRYLPNRVLLYADGEDGQNWLQKSLAFMESIQPLNGRPAVYLCENFTCELPTSDAKTLAERLDNP